MKIVFIGCVQLSQALLKSLLDVKEAEIVGVVTRRSSAFNADFCSLEGLARTYGIPCLCLEDNDQLTLGSWLRNLGPDVIYCFGWSFLLNKDILGIPPKGVIGYHPAALPQNRGRHPIIWALVLGLQETASTFFFMDEAADAGDILSQRMVMIEDEDDASCLYDKLANLATMQVSQFTPQLATGTYVKVPQDHTKSNYWRRRGRQDGRIDWRMSDTSINNLVRALTVPYVGAHFEYNGNEIKVWKTEIAKCEADWDRFEPGKVLKTENGIIWVNAGRGL